MPAADEGAWPGHQLRSEWRVLVERWSARRHLAMTAEAGAMTLEFRMSDSDRILTVRFTATSSLLVAFMTNGRTLKPDQLAIAAAAANAWNTEQLIPMLSVWDVRGPTPCIAGVCAMPLACRLTQPDFDAVANEWVEHGRVMFVRCQELFQL